jgi:hypothetical protein
MGSEEINIADFEGARLIRNTPGIKCTIKVDVLKLSDVK